MEDGGGSFSAGEMGRKVGQLDRKRTGGGIRMGLKGTGVRSGKERKFKGRRGIEGVGGVGRDGSLRGRRESGK